MLCQVASPHRWKASMCAVGERVFSSDMLFRDHVGRVLGEPRDGYFCKHSQVVGQIAKPLDFRSMVGKSGYDATLRKLYANFGISWLTPVEIFQPHYGNAVARHILDNYAAKATGRLKICELGAGNGTLACNILDYVKANEPGIYSTMRYTIMEVSQELCERQSKRIWLRDNTHIARFKPILADATQAHGWQQLASMVAREGGGEVFVIGTEVLDNMPHDRVTLVDGDWHETRISYLEGQPQEHLGRISDSRIATCLEAFPWLEAGSEVRGEYLGGGILGTIEAFIMSGSPSRSQQGSTVFLPTGALAIFEHLHAHVPDHSVLFADFDQLPDVQIEGIGAPLVSRTVYSRSEDFATYLVPVGAADIFFPTDFDAICSLYRVSSGAVHMGGRAEARHQSTARFFAEHADVGMTCTLSGYNPLLEDFRNTRVFTACAASG